MIPICGIAATKGKLGRCILLLVVCAALCVPARGAEVLTENETDTVLVAGNPDLYPLEYYDPETGQFAGVLPDLLAKLGEETGRAYRYLNPSETDERGALAGAQQVELVSGLVDGEGTDWGLTGRTEVLLTLPEGRPVRIGWTAAADDDTVAALNSFLSDLDGRALAEAVLARTQPPARRTWLPWALGITGAVCTGTLVWLLMQRRRKAERIAQAHTDPLTGLGNLDWYQQAFDKRIHDRSRVLYCLIYFGVDLERLRLLGGPQAAEEELRRMAGILRERCGPEDILARVREGGFALLRKYSRKAELDGWIGETLTLLRTGGETDALRVSAGSYCLTAADRDPIAVLFNAELGCHQAREQQLDHLEAESAVLRQSEQLRRSLTEIRQGLSGEQFRLYLQPLTAAQDGSFVGAEALCRWQHPARGLLGPNQFVELMEREGVIPLLDYYMLEHVCAQLEAMAGEGLDSVYITCNFSPVTLDAESFWPDFSAVLERFRFERSRLVVEVTESLLSRAPGTRRRNLLHLRSAGVRIALDDFGSGYTSFRDLASGCYDFVKIDKSLVDAWDTPEGQNMVAGLIRFSHQLGLGVLCEGVESRDQAQLLRSLGCDTFQGFYFCRPLPAAEAVRLFREN